MFLTPVEPDLSLFMEVLASPKQKDDVVCFLIKPI